MKKVFLAAVFFYAVSVNAQACLPDISFWADFKGSIGEREIALSVYQVSAGVLLGNYRYTDDEGKLFAVTGSLKDCIYYLEVISDEKKSGKFMLSYTFDKIKKEDKYTGNFTAADNKQNTVTLQLKSMAGGTVTQRYGALFGTSQEVDSFATKIKAAIINNDKHWLAQQCKYPLRVNEGKKSVVIKDKQEFVLKYNKIFTPAYISKIKKISCYNMFSNQDGACMGNGQIYINHTVASTPDNYKYCISAVNIF